MNIGLLVQRFPFGGAESYVEQIAQRLHKQGETVTVVTSTHNDSLDKSYPFKIIRLPALFSIGEYSFWKGLGNILKKEKFDIVHINSYGYFHSDYAAFLKKKFNYKLVMTSHGFHGIELHLLKKNKIINKSSSFDFFRSFYDKHIGKKTISNSDRLIALSKRDIEFYKQMNIEESKIIPIPLGIKNSFFLPAKEDPQKMRSILKADPILLSVGEFSWIKAKALAINAMPLILKEKPNAKLFFIGKDRTELHTLKGLCHKLGVEKSVSFLGFKEDDDLISYMHASDLLLHTSLAEGLSTVLLEAMACGLPFITTPAGGNGILVKESGAGVTIPFEDENALARTVLELIEDKDRLKTLASNGHMYSQDMQWDKIYEKIANVYRDLLNDDFKFNNE